jgi:hypothetical protein
MRLLKPVKILLLLYLSIAALFPSYQGYEKGQEFHFFDIDNLYTECHHHSRPEVEASHDREHAHTILHFCPARWSHKLTSPNGKHQFSFLPSTELITETAKLCGSLLPFSQVKPTVIYEKKASGLSPPIS